MIRIATHVLASYVLLLVTAVVWTRLPFERAVPDLVAISAIYLGLTARDRMAPSVAAAAVLGYLADVLMGTPHGLLSLTAGIVCVFGHLVQGRLLVRGWLYTATFTLLTGLASGLLVLGISGVMRLRVGDLRGELWVAVASALLTGAVGPAMFSLYRRIDARFARTQRDRVAVLEGLLS